MDEDCEDQACPPTDSCVLFSCQTWEGNRPIRPKLERRGRYWCCPYCGSSYGEQPFGGKQEAVMTDLERIDGLYIGQLNEHELRVFEQARKNGEAVRAWDSFADTTLGIAKVKVVRSAEGRRR